MCRLGITFGVSRHRLDHVVGEVPRVRRGEPDPLQALDLAAGAQQLAERQLVAELGAVGVHVLAEQGDLDDAVGDQRAGSRPGCRRGGGPSPCRAATGRCRRCRCCCSRPRSTPTRSTRTGGGPAAGTGRWSRVSSNSACASLALRARSSSLGSGADVVRAVDDVDPGGTLGDLLPLHLGQAAADGDLHARVRLLGGEQVTEVAVQPVGRVLADRAGVEHHQVRGLAVAAAL